MADQRNNTLHLGTRDGVISYVIDDGGNLTETGHILSGQAVRGMATHPDNPDLLFIACGLRGWGLHVSEDGGSTARSIGFDDRWAWDVVIDPAEPDTILVGTEPPAMFRGHRSNGSWTFEEFTGIQHVPSRSRWTFFHEPFRAGHVHGIARTAERPERIVAGVEHGAVILSRDGGTTWQDTLVGFDVHRVIVHPDEPDTVYVGAGNGLHVSRDGGESWTAIPDLRGKYVHTIQFQPDNARSMLVYVDSSACPLYRSDDGGESWRCIGAGLPATRPADPVRFVPSNIDMLYYAGDTGSQASTIYRSDDGGKSWNHILEGLPKVWRMHIA